jgi:clan AA aspartic protease
VTSGREAVVPIAVLGPDGKRAPVDATIDTGFNGFLTLPPSLVSALDLPFAGSTSATLGDGSTASLDLFLGAIEWHGDAREVLVLEVVGGVLLGMATLEGSRLAVDVVDGGAVTIRAL